ncbi:unnamed protein product [Aureobasidium mustum]|uniref:Fungal calcium binding protein domain-containing protein n=1 Tax=Aureobasidium mustum TaxID=2773714 RepID=A0A9N8PMB3_9PEZI|nr:unnamed protein product [Aureobasidium mustum]
MQFTIIAALAMAATAFAAPVEELAQPQVLISLPPGCTKSNLASGSCAAAAAELGANPIADLSCVGSAAGTAANFDECKSCIPKSTRVIEN